MRECLDGVIGRIAPKKRTLSNFVGDTTYDTIVIEEELPLFEKWGLEGLTSDGVVFLYVPGLLHRGETFLSNGCWYLQRINSQMTADSRKEFLLKHLEIHEAHHAQIYSIFGIPDVRLVGEDSFFQFKQWNELFAVSSMPYHCLQKTLLFLNK